MPSSVKPRLLAKVVNFSLTSALGVWVRPGAAGRSLWPPFVWRIPVLPLLPSPGCPQTPPRVEPKAQWRAWRGDTYCRAWPCGSPALGLGHPLSSFWAVVKGKVSRGTIWGLRVGELESPHRRGYEVMG